MAKRRAVLGIDAAWTVGQPSGVALVHETDDGWSCAAVAPSYASFIGLHPALLKLLGCDRRVPYKVSRSAKYWPGANPTERIELLLGEFRKIHAALAARIDDVNVPLPGAAPTLSTLKRYEDGLDALVSAWVGIECLEGRGEAFGDSTAAIWCPRSPGS